jgi:hypothetical protein
VAPDPNYTPDCEEPLIDYAQQPWRAVTGPHLVALVRAGAVFDTGVLIERPNSQNQEFRREEETDPQVLTTPTRLNSKCPTIVACRNDEVVPANPS